MKDTDQPILHKDGVSYVLPFILVTCCFALWGFANDITNPMVKAFSKICLLYTSPSPRAVEESRMPSSA